MTFQEGLRQIDKANVLIKEANELTVDSVMNVFLFTWQWWIALGMMIIPWVVWLLVRKHESSARLFSAGLLVAVISEVMDSVGVSFGMWAYPVKVIPVATVSFSFRLSVLPVVVMLLLQYKPNFNPLIKGILFGGFGAYIGLPLLSMIDLYQKLNWLYTYSFFILTTIYLLAHWFSRLNSFDQISERK